MRNFLLIFTGALYAALVLTGAAHHEPWFDEAQSWLLARDLTPWQLIAAHARYEGTPVLWQLILMPFAKLGFPYQRISFISATLAIAGAAILLVRAPFPLWMRLAIPFTYFPLYQFAVVARSYSLLLPLLAAIAATGRRRIVAYTVLLVLLANVSLHGALISAVLVIDLLWNVRSRRRTFFIVASLFAILYAALFFELRLPPDLLTRLNEPFSIGNAGIRLFKQISEAFLGGLGSNVYRAFSTLFGVAVVAITCFVVRGRALMLFAAMSSLLLLLALKQAANWHAGVLFLVWVFALWGFFQTGRSRLLEAVVAAVLAVQVWFGLRSIAWDRTRVYSGSEAAAAYIKAAGEDRMTIDGFGFKSFALQPYFDRNLFALQEHGRRGSFYPWTIALDHENLTFHRRPERIVLGIGSLAQYSEAGYFRTLGYCEEKRFEGGIWWKNAIAEPDSYIILRPCSPGAWAL